MTPREAAEAIYAECAWHVGRVEDEEPSCVPAILAALAAAGFAIVPADTGEALALLRAALERLSTAVRARAWDEGNEGGSIAGALVQARVALEAAK